MKLLSCVVLTIFLVKSTFCQNTNKHVHRETRSPPSKLSRLHKLADDFENLRLPENYIPETEFYFNEPYSDILEPFPKEVKNTFRAITSSKPNGHKNIVGHKPFSLPTKSATTRSNKPEKANIEQPVTVNNIGEKKETLLENTLGTNDENVINNNTEEISNSSSISVTESHQREDNSTLIKHNEIKSDSTEKTDYCHESIILSLEPCEAHELTNKDICTNADICSQDLVVDLYESYEREDFESVILEEVSGRDLIFQNEYNITTEQKENSSYATETVSHEPYHSEVFESSNME